MERTKDLQYPTFPGKGIMWWWEASIGTNPHIHRPRKDFPSGFVNCLYERVRSGVIHIGLRHDHLVDGRAQRRAHGPSRRPLARAPLFPDLYGRARRGRQRERHRERPPAGARRSAASASFARNTAMPICGSTSSWNPAVPGINMAGRLLGPLREGPAALGEDRARGLPQLSSDVHADGRRRRQSIATARGAEWWKGGCCNHSGVSRLALPGNCCGHDH